MPRYYIVREDDPSGCGCLLLVVIIVAIGFAVYHNTSAFHNQSSSGTSSSDLAQLTVQQYYDAINKHNYRVAYNTWQDNVAGTGQPYSQFVDGYRNTVRDDITFDSTDVQDDSTVNVTITIHATERTGTETFSASYVIEDVGGVWKIMSGSIQKTA